jgi:hypothetical protein
MSRNTKPESLVIAPRFCGPPGSGNGGYVCGRIAAYADGPVEVTLRRPPPLAVPMSVERDGGRDGGRAVERDNGRDGESAVRVYHGGTLIAEGAASPGGPALETPGVVSMAHAQALAGGARYYADPVFPDCFVCGMSRVPGDGLGIFPGPVAGGSLWAAPWTPDPSVTDDDGANGADGANGEVRPEIVWAALDCPSGIAAAEAAGLGPDTAILLGRMTASLAALPVAGDQCRVIAWLGGRDGRKLTAGSALLAPGGEVIAAARTVWITVPRPVPAPAAEGAS